MKNFISNKIVAVLVGNLGSIALIAFGSHLFFIGSELLQKNFVLGAFLISLLPITLFLSALVYQNYVVGNCRQLTLVESNKCSHLQKSAILALKDAFDSARYVPMMLIGMTCVVSFILVSPIIGQGIINGQEFILTFFGSLFILLQIYIGFKAYSLTVNAYHKLSDV